MESSIFLTGANGFLGSHVLRLLLASGRKVICAKRAQSSLSRIAGLLDGAQARAETIDLESGLLDAIFQKERFGAVIHCATDYGRKLSAPWQIASSNIALPLRILDLAARQDCPFFINTDTILDKRISPYSLSKSQFVQWLEHFSPKIASRSLAFEHFYGPFDDPTKFTAQVIGALARQAPFIDFSPGEQKRYFLHVEDAADAIVCALHHMETSRAQNHERIEVGSEESISIKAFAQMAWEEAGKPATELRFGAFPYREHEVMNPEIDLAPILAMGWRPKTPLREGLRASILAERSFAP